MRPIVFAVGLLLAACGASDPLPAPEGVAPLGAAPSAAPASSAPIVLEEPPPLPDAPVDEAPAASIPDGPPAMLVFEVEPLGRFEVITWAEAERRATERIGPDSYQSELGRLRADVLRRSR
jgi:hypothetical protein